MQTITIDVINNKALKLSAVATYQGSQAKIAAGCRKICCKIQRLHEQTARFGY